MAELPITRSVNRVQGDDWYFTFRVVAKTSTADPGTPVDMSGITAQLQVRTSESRTSALQCTGTLVSTPSDLVNGLIKMRVDRLTGGTAGTVVTPQAYWYDVQILNGGDLQTYYRGQWTVIPEITI